MVAEPFVGAEDVAHLPLNDLRRGEARFPNGALLDNAAQLVLESLHVVSQRERVSNVAR